MKDSFVASLDALVLDAEIACAIVIAALLYYERRRDRFRHFVMGVLVGILLVLLAVHGIAP